MLVVGFKADISKAMSRLSSLEQEQAPFATALALTKTAQWAQKKLTEEISSAFRAPSGYTKQAIYITTAKKRDLNATIGIKNKTSSGNPQVRYFGPEVAGGGRNTKGFENVLIHQGIMQRGWYAVPTSAAPKNISLSFITELLSQVRAEENAQIQKVKGKKIGIYKTFARYFAIKVGDRQAKNHTPGIYERLGLTGHSKIRPIFIFSRRKPLYRKRYDFYAVGERAARDVFPGQLKLAMERAIATAR